MKMKNGRAKRVLLENVSVRYGSVSALNNISLDIQPGELVSLLGPSGCGKTTLLRSIAGFAPLTTGEIFIGEEACTDLPPSKRNLGMVFQDYALFPHMTVARNVAFGLKMRRVPLEERHPAVEKVLALLSLDGLEERYPRQLSGGQQQRVALARALVVEPGVLLLDEPLAALDKKLREEMQIELRSLQKRIGITTIFVTHDQEEALTLSDRVAVLEKGRIVQVGTPVEVYENPQSKFSGLFVGKSNFIEGKVISCTEGATVCDVSGMGRVTVKSTAGVGTQAQFLLRPEKVRLSREIPLHLERNCVCGKVEHLVYLGMITEYHLETEQGFQLVATVLNVNQSTQNFEIGESIWATWSPDDFIQVFPMGPNG